MEKFNLNFSGGDNVIKSICWIMSVLSWLLLIATGWASLNWLSYDFEDDRPKMGIIWTIYKYQFFKRQDGNLYVVHTFPFDNSEYQPFQMQAALIYIVFILTLIIIVAGFCFYMVKSTCKKDDAVYNGMMGQWSKFHFFPLLCVSALFIIGETYDDLYEKRLGIYQEKEDYSDRWKSMVIAAFIFTIIGLASLIFIYIMTDLNTDWYILLTLKKGTYSCLIVLLWYYFCYLIYELRWVHAIDYNNDHQNNPKDFKLDDWRKGCGIAFSIIFGIGSLVFAFIFKDLVVAGMNCLIYVGLITYYFKLRKKIRELKNANKNGDGAVDIIMMVFSIVLIAFLILTKREECLKS